LILPAPLKTQIATDAGTLSNCQRLWKRAKGPRLSAAGLHFVLIRQSVQIAIRKNRKEISYNLIKINKYNCLKMQQK